MSESLPMMLKVLRLPAFGQYYSEYQQQAIEKAWLVAIIPWLCEQEVAQRFQPDHRLLDGFGELIYL